MLIARPPGLCVRTGPQAKATTSELQIGIQSLRIVHRDVTCWQMYFGECGSQSLGRCEQLCSMCGASRRQQTGAAHKRRKQGHSVQEQHSGRHNAGTVQHTLAHTQPATAPHPHPPVRAASSSSDSTCHSVVLPAARCTVV